MSSLSDKHFYYNYEQVRNNGEYDTITRVDETDLDIRNQKVSINFTSLTECNSTSLRGPGLMCGDLCWRNAVWCRGDRSISCDVPGGKFTTDNKALCGNTTLWQNTTCDNFYPDGDKAALGLRCSGGVQHCAYPWYLSGNYYYEVSEQLNIYICTVSIPSQIVDFKSNRDRCDSICRIAHVCLCVHVLMIHIVHGIIPSFMMP